jgi:ABC-type phosphate transport system ATPase subunit
LAVAKVVPRPASGGTGLSMRQPALSIKGLTLRAGGKLVLKDLDLALPPTGMTALMGPVGAGKSSLVKWICGRADPDFYTADVRHAVYFHAPLNYRNRPSLYGQRQSQTIDQMMLHISVLLSSNPPVLCVDEPTADLSPEDSARLLQRLAIVAQGRAVLIVSHNQAEMQRYSDHVALLAGGQIKETTPTQEFFDHPRTTEGQQFLGSGWVATAGLNTPADHLTTDLRAKPFDLTIRPVGADGRLREIVPGKLFVYRAPDDPAIVAKDITDLRKKSLGRLVCTNAAPVRAKALLAAAGLPAVRLPAFKAGSDFSSVRADCQAIRVELDRDKPLTFLTDGQDPGVVRAIGLLLISMGFSADHAARAAAEVARLPALDPALEQEFWDFELSSDLDRDGVDPHAFRVKATRISYDAVSKAAPRQVSGKTPQRPRRTVKQGRAEQFQNLEG